MIKSLLLYSLFFIVLIPGSQARVDSSKKWLEKQSANFHLVFNAEQTELSTLILSEAEKSHQLLSKYFKQLPEKTYIVLDDQSPYANGSASVFPYPIIRLNTALPTYETSISGYGNWYFELILHEMVHIANLYPTNSYYHALYKVFGSIVRVNRFLPRWQTEGLAVAFESFLSFGGRLRSDFYESYARALTDEDLWENFLSSIELSETDIPTYPFGMRPYFFGSLFWLNSLNENGLEQAGLFTDEVASSLPFTHRSSSEKLNQKPEEESFLDAYKSIKSNSLDQLQAMQSELQPKQLLLENWRVRGLKIHPSSGELYMIRSSISESDHLYNHSQKEILIRQENIRAFDLHPTEPKILIIKEKIVNNLYTRSALTEFDRETKKTKTLFESESARDASYSPSGKRILFTSETNGITKLNILNSESLKPQLVLKLKLGEAIWFPRWLNNESIVYIKRAKDSSSVIFQHKLSENTSTRLFGFLDEVSFLDVVKSKLYFTSSHSGIRQAYSTDSDQTSFSRIGFSKTMVLDFAYQSSRQDLWSTEMTSEGFKLFRTNRPELKRQEKKFKPIFPLLAKASPTPTKPTQDELGETPSASYNGNQALWPRYWLPFIYPYGEGTSYQVTTGSADPLGVHSYQVSLSYDTFTQKNNYGLSYLNRSLLWDINLSHNQFYQNLISANTVILRKITSVNASNFLFNDSNQWRWGLSASSNFNAAAADNRQTSIGANLSLNKLDISRVLDLAPPGGYALNSGLTYYLNSKNIEAFSVLGLDFSHYYSLPYQKHHKLISNVKLDKRSSSSTDIYASLVSAGGNLGGVGIKQFHLNRGYPFSQFLAWSALSVNLEYRLPLFRIYKGSDRLPVFFKNLYMGVIWDSILLDGFYYNRDSNSFIRDKGNTNFSSVGVEFTLDTKLAYHLPAKVILGLYQGFSEEAQGGFRGGLQFLVPLF